MTDIFYMSKIYESKLYFIYMPRIYLFKVVRLTNSTCLIENLS